MPVTAKLAILDLHLRIAFAFLRRLHGSQLSFLDGQPLPSLIFKFHLVLPFISPTLLTLILFPDCYNNHRLFGFESLAIKVASKITEQALDTLFDLATSALVGVSVARLEQFLLNPPALVQQVLLSLCLCLEALQLVLTLLQQFLSSQSVKNPLLELSLFFLPHH